MTAVRKASLRYFCSQIWDSEAVHGFIKEAIANPAFHILNPSNRSQTLDSEDYQRIIATLVTVM